MSARTRVHAAFALSIVAGAALAACSAEPELVGAAREAITPVDMATGNGGGGGGPPANPTPSDCGFKGDGPGDGQCRYSVDNRSVEVDHCPDGYGCPKTSDDATTQVANCVALDNACASAGFAGLVEKLGDRDYFVREATQKQIAACCASTGYLSLLQEALSTTSVPEISARLERAVGACKFRLRPCGCEPVKGDTPTCKYPVATYSGSAKFDPFCEKDEKSFYGTLECTAATYGPPESPIPSPFFSRYYLEPTLRCPATIPERNGRELYSVLASIPIDDPAVCNDKDKLKAYIAKMAPAFCNDQERTVLVGLGPVPACLAPGVPDLSK